MAEQGTVRIWLLVMIAASCAACWHARINKFDVAPRHVCPGSRVELTWDITGSGSITVTPPIAHAPHGAVRSNDAAEIFPIAPAKVALHVTRAFGEPAHAEVDIEMTQGETVAASLADPTAACRDSVVSSTAHIRNFAPEIRAAVVDVRPGDHRIYEVAHTDEVTHQRVTAQVAGTAPTTRFAGLSIVGDWTLSSRLLPGESCEPSRLPSNLVVVAYTQCAGGGQQ